MPAELSKQQVKKGLEEGRFDYTGRNDFFTDRYNYRYKNLRRAFTGSIVLFTFIVYLVNSKNLLSTDTLIMALFVICFLPFFYRWYYARFLPKFITVTTKEDKDDILIRLRPLIAKEEWTILKNAPNYLRIQALEQPLWGQSQRITILFAQGRVLVNSTSFESPSITPRFLFDWRINRKNEQLVIDAILKE